MSALTLLSDDAEMGVRSDLLGDLKVRSTDVLTFPVGMLGFPECRRFALLRGGRDGLFWLQSMEYSALVFLLVDPFAIEQNYSFDVQPTQIAELGPGEASDIGLLAVVTLRHQAGDRDLARSSRTQRRSSRFAIGHSSSARASSSASGTG